MITVINKNVINKYLLNAFIFLSILFTATLAAAQEDSNPYIGKRLYRSYCMVCHGQLGNSLGPLAQKLGLSPADLTSDKYQKKSIEEMSKIIGGYGRAVGDLMPVWRNAITESNIKNIAAYLAVIKSSDLRMIGDVRRGRALFQSACASCHGPKGKGNGILAKIIGAPMVDFTQQKVTGHYSDKALVELIRNGKGKFMPGWKSALNRSEINDVAAYVRSFIK